MFKYMISMDELPSTYSNTDTSTTIMI